MFENVSNAELYIIEGGVDLGSIVGGALIFTAGVGCLAVACVPGVNIAVAAGVAYLGSWGLAGGVFTTAYGLVTK